MVKKLIIGNWKMNPSTLKDAKKNFEKIKKGASILKNVDAVIASPFVYLETLSKVSNASLKLSAQNISAEKEGAFTGEISAGMLSNFKVSYTIVGHSERRDLGESNEFINKKIKQLLAKNITPVLCVGEKERDGSMFYLGVVKTQVEECLAGIPKTSFSKVVIAYEPVWALSSTENRRDATPEDFEEMRIYIRKIISDIAGAQVGKEMKILYGGSVDEKNAEGFLVHGKADGLLPGRASLTPEKFLGILQVANGIK